MYLSFLHDYLWIGANGAAYEREQEEVVELSGDEDEDVAELIWSHGTTSAQGVTVSPIHEGGAGPAGNKYERDAAFDEEFPADAEDDNRNAEPVDERIFASQHPFIRGRARASQIIISTFENSIDSLSGFTFPNIFMLCKFLKAYACVINSSVSRHDDGVSTRSQPL